MHPVLLAFVISVAVNAAFFVYAAIRKTDVVTDLSYSLSFALVALALAALNGATDPYRLALTAMVVVWAIRLGSYLFTRIIKVKVDHRFDAMRDKPLKFARFWILQAVTVGIVLVPAAVAMSAPGAFSALAAVGLCVWAAGLIIETVADQQKKAFRQRGDAGFIATGLWSWSRHPNYFGESLAWIGVYLFCLPNLGAWTIPALVSPVGITALLLFVSGIPLLEKASDKKFGHLPEYADYKRRTSVFILLPPRSR
ncbi:MAG TPA: DUF1295 domain-containing protein [Spirochaetales bacterium]|nr:DUF1295 domain-containing protein [Spirochaetia bacterium]HPE36244.1 DUF1295 domain-containing protein [Spirochaetales bacterium]